MVKSPIEYFEAQSFDPRPNDGELSSTERLFMQKYLGVGDEKAVLPKIKEVEGAPDVETKPLEEASLEAGLQDEPQIQFVGFYMSGQLYTIPTLVVQEVIRSVPPSRLPMTSQLVSGVINLRGRITPLIRLRDVLEISVPADKSSVDRFTIICRCRGLQVGIQIDSVRNMYRVEQKDIQWNVEVQLGINGDCVTGLFKLDEKLVPIISVERIVDTMLHE